MGTYAAHWGPEALLTTGNSLRVTTTYTVMNGGTSTPATLYTNRTKGTVQANPGLVTTAGGNAEFWALNAGYYDIWIGGALVLANALAYADPADVAGGGVTSVDGATGVIDLTITYVPLAGAATISGLKDFTTAPTVNGAPIGGTSPDATTSVKGLVKLAGDLAGTAALPTVPGLATNAAAIASEAATARAAEALKLAKASNLSDLADATAARTNLGLGTAATQASSAFDAAGAATAAAAASIPLTQKGAASGVASLTSGTKVTNAQLPGSVRLYARQNLR